MGAGHKRLPLLNMVRLCESPGVIRTVSFSHSGRRGFITKLAHSGISSKVIMELAGHKHLSTTQRYIEVDDRMKSAAVEVV